VKAGNVAIAGAQATRPPEAHDAFHRWMRYDAIGFGAKARTMN
jgi:hypothetical protein